MDRSRIIVILGMHRSGTSALARAVQAMGAELGDTLMPPVDSNNPKGFFEDLEINRLCDRVLDRFGLRWDSISRIPAVDLASAKVDDLIESAIRLLTRKVSGASPFCFKNPRAAVLLPFWKAVFERMSVAPEFLISVRNPFDVASSLMARDNMNRGAGIALWLRHYEMVLRHTSDSNRLFVSYDRLVEQPERQIERISSFLQLEGPSEAIDEFVSDFLDRELRHHVEASGELSADNSVSGSVRRLASLLDALSMDRISDGGARFHEQWSTIQSAISDQDPVLDLAGQFQAALQRSRIENHKLKEAWRLALQEQEQGGGIVDASLDGEARSRNSANAYINALRFDGSVSEITKGIDRLDELIRRVGREQADGLSGLAAQVTAAEEGLAAIGRLNGRLEELESGRLQGSQRVAELEAEVGRHERRAAASRTELMEANRRATSNEVLAVSREQAIAQACQDLKLLLSQLTKEYGREPEGSYPIDGAQEPERLLGELVARLRTAVQRVASPAHVQDGMVVSAGRRLRAIASRPARLAWRMIPVPARHKSAFKARLFQRASGLFYWSKAYSDWLEFERHHGRQTDELPRTRIEPVSASALPSRESVQKVNNGPLVQRGESKADENLFRLERRDQVWTGRSRILDLLAGTDQVLHEQLSPSTRRFALQLASEVRTTVSVIVPTWNREGTVCEAIDSALSQSFLPTEIIVSDDGSTDGTIQKLKETYPTEIASGQIVLVENEHLGVSAARNAGMARAKGEIFAYLDSDNKWRPDFLLMMVAALAENDEIVTAYAGLRSFDLDENSSRVRASYYDRRQLLAGNFIDLNIFVHRRVVFDQLGGFDESLSRLVDWELIIRYTKNYTPLFLPFVGVDYYLSAGKLSNITHTVRLDENRNKVLDKHFLERRMLGLESLRLAYFVYDYPAKSQTFVFNEIRWLRSNGYDVKVYYAIVPDDRAELDFDVESYQVADSDELAKLFVEHERNVCHSHFVFPGVTLFVRPACIQAGVYYSFMPHAVDIFHYKNRERNRVAEVANDPRCLKVFVYGDHHRNFLVSAGVANSKIAYAFQAVDREDFAVTAASRHDVPFAAGRPARGIVIARFIEKKGIQHLLVAMQRFRKTELVVTLYGYGPMEDEFRATIAELRLENVEFGGPINGKSDLARAYSQADFLIAPCVEASNGDMDGFPTVILEAVFAGVPVVTTSVSAIPDYLRDDLEAIVVRPADADSLADGISRLLRLSEEKRQLMTARAQRSLGRATGTQVTMGRLLDVWNGYSLEIVLVTFNTQGYDDRPETLEIIRRVLAHTTTGFTLTIVDNASDLEFWHQVVEATRGLPNVRLIRKRENVLCGPGTNIAIRLGSEPYLIYLCSKEGFVKSHGWERTLLGFIRDNPGVPIAGDISYLPKYVLGEEMVGFPDFPKFRGQSHALENPKLTYGHVQGGIFIADRQMLQDLGGFSADLPQSNMDVEMSYWVLANGYRLGHIPGVNSRTTKTLPRLPSILDEGTVVAHPLTLESVDYLDRLVAGESEACNLCGQIRVKTSSEYPVLRTSDGSCTNCGSTPFGRSVYRELSGSHLIHRGGSLLMLSSDSEVAEKLGERMFSDVQRYSDAGGFEAALLASPPGSVDCIALDGDVSKELDLGSLFQQALVALSVQGVLYIACSDIEKARDRLIFARDQVNGMASPDACRIAVLDHQSEVLGLDWRPLFRVSRGDSMWHSVLPEVELLA